MAEPLDVSPLNKCSDTPQYRQHYLEKAADKVLADPDAQYYLTEAKKGNTFITIDGLLALANVKIVKGLRKQFDSILLRKIKDPAKKLALKPKRVKLTKEDIFFVTSPNYKIASEQLAIQHVLNRVEQLVKSGKYASLLNIIKGGTKRLGSRIKLIECLAAIHAIGNTKYRAAVTWLIKVVQQGKDENLRLQAMAALGKIGDKRATHVLLKVADPDYVNWEKVMNVARGFSGPSVFSHEVALGLAVSTMPDSSREELIKTQKLALTALARIGDKRAIPTIMRIAGRDLLGLAPVALSALAQMPEVIVDHQDAFKAMLVKLLDSDDIQLKNTATMILATLGDRRAVPNLIKMLSQTNFNNIDLNPARNISRLVKADPSLITGKDVPVVFRHVYNRFLTRYTKANIPIVKMAIVERLVALRDSRAILPLIILAKREPKTRKYIVAALARLVNQKNLPMMIALLGHADRTVRHFAVYFLGYVNDIRSIRPLIKLLYDKDPKIEREAIKSLARLSDMPDVRRSFFIKALAKKYDHKSTNSVVKQLILKAVKYIRERERNEVTASN